VLDEVDTMTPDAQSALRRIIEAYSKVTRFCLVCNYVTRVIEPLASRCAKFRFKPLPVDSMKGRMRDIAGRHHRVFICIYRCSTFYHFILCYILTGFCTCYYMAGISTFLYRHRPRAHRIVGGDPGSHPPSIKRRHAKSSNFPSIVSPAQRWSVHNIPGNCY
jgi:hypothetical protein